VREFLMLLPCQPSRQPRQPKCGSEKLPIFYHVYLDLSISYLFVHQPYRPVVSLVDQSLFNEIDVDQDVDQLNDEYFYHTSATSINDALISSYFIQKFEEE